MILPALKEPRRILIVDDFPDVVETSKSLLEAHGHTVFTALDSRSALEICKTITPHVIFTDLKGIEHRDGFQLCMQLRQQRRFEKSVLFAISGFSDPRSIRHAEEVGFDYFSVKPIDPTVFIESVYFARPRPMVRSRLSLIERTADLFARCGARVNSSALSIQSSIELLNTHQEKFFGQTVVFESVSPEKLAKAISKEAVRLGGFRRVFYVVVDANSGQLAQVDGHFRTASAAKVIARKFGLNGYYYPVYERRTPKREVFPHAQQVLHYLTHQAFSLVPLVTKAFGLHRTERRSIL